MFRKKTSCSTLLEQGNQYLNSNQYQSAINSFTTVLNQISDPQSKVWSDAWYGRITAKDRLAALSEQEQDWELAEEYWQKLQQLVPESETYIKALAVVRHQRYTVGLTRAASIVYPQVSFRIDNIVIQRGGIKGLAYLGALEVLYSSIAIESVRRVGGTSAGGMSAFLFAVCTGLAEVKQLLIESGRQSSLLFLQEKQQALSERKLHQAVLANKPEELIALIQSGYPTDLIRANGQTELNIAVEQENKPMLLTLIYQHVFACSNPNPVVSYIEEALESPWINKPNLMTLLEDFCAHHSLRTGAHLKMAISISCLSGYPKLGRSNKCRMMI